MKLLTLPFLLLIAVSALFSCKKKSKCNCNNQRKVCTDIFAFTSIEVTDSLGSPVRLDSLETVRSSDGLVIRKEVVDTGEAAPQYYTVLSDAEESSLKKCAEDFTFKGYLNNETVVNIPFEASTDCCHINTSGIPQSVIIEP